MSKFSKFRQLNFDETYLFIFLQKKHFCRTLPKIHFRGKGPENDFISSISSTLILEVVTFCTQFSILFILFLSITINILNILLHKVCSSPQLSIKSSNSTIISSEKEIFARNLIPSHLYFHF